jgi:glycosyltransferase involved in cell wall biosynthesis
VYTAQNVFFDKRLTRIVFGKHIAAVSEAVKNNLLEVFGTADRRVRVIYNGVDIAPPAATDCAALLARLGLCSADRIITCIARFTSQKGHTFLLQALLVIRQQYPTLKLLLVGDGVLKEPLQASVDRMKLDRTVLFCGNQPAVAPFIAISEFTVSASLAEGLSLAVVESLQLGKPVVATAVGGTPEAVKGGETGLLVPPGNTPALASAITFMLEHPEVAAAMGRNGYALARKHFTKEKMTRGYHTYYEHVLRSHSESCSR